MLSTCPGTGNRLCLLSRVFQREFSSTYRCGKCDKKQDPRKYHEDLVFLLHIYLAGAVGEDAANIIMPITMRRIPRPPRVRVRIVRPVPPSPLEPPVVEDGVGDGVAEGLGDGLGDGDGLGVGVGAPTVNVRGVGDIAGVCSLGAETVIAYVPDGTLLGIVKVVEKFPALSGVGSLDTRTSLAPLA